MRISNPGLRVLHHDAGLTLPSMSTLLIRAFPVVHQMVSICATQRKHPSSTMVVELSERQNPFL